MAQPPATNIHYRNNTSTTNQPPQLLTNIRSTQIAAKKKKKPTTKERQSERWIERRGKRVRSMATSGWDHLPNPNLSPAKPTFKLTPPSTTFNHQIHQPLAAVKNPSTTIDEPKREIHHHGKPIYHHWWIWRCGRRSQFLRSCGCLSSSLGRHCRRRRLLLCCLLLARVWLWEEEELGRERQILKKEKINKEMRGERKVE